MKKMYRHWSYKYVSTSRTARTKSQSDEWMMNDDVLIYVYIIIKVLGWHGPFRHVTIDVDEPAVVLMSVVVGMPPLGVGVAVAFFGGDSALGLILGVDAHGYPCVADKASLEMPPLLVLGTIADLHE